MTLPAKNKFDPTLAISDQASRPTQSFRDYMTKLDALVTALAAGNLASSLVNAASDAAAAKAGVPVGAMYRSGNTLHVRLV